MSDVTPRLTNSGLRVKIFLVSGVSLLEGKTGHPTFKKKNPACDIRTTVNGFDIASRSIHETFNAVKNGEKIVLIFLILS